MFDTDRSVAIRKIKVLKCPPCPAHMTRSSPFRSVKTCPEIICLAMVPYVRDLLSQHDVEELLPERGIEIGQESLRFRCNRFGPMRAVEQR